MYISLHQLKPKLSRFFLDSADNIADRADDLVILGDFNLGFISWDPHKDSNYMVPSNHNSPLGHSITDFVFINNLFQVNAIANSDNRFLDLVITSCRDAYVVSPSSELSKCYKQHPNLLLNLPYNKLVYLKPKCKPRYNFYSADYPSIVKNLKGVDWQTKLSGCENIDLMLIKFYKIVDDLLEEYVPKQTLNKSKFPKWFSRFLLHQTITRKGKNSEKVQKIQKP